MSELMDGDAYVARAYRTSMLSSANGEIVLLCLAGELDLFTIPAMRVQLAECLTPQPGYLIVDISELSFCSVRGLDLLVHTSHAAERVATSYVVSGASARLERLWRKLWLTSDLPVMYHTAAQAITAASRSARPVRYHTSREVVGTVALTPTRPMPDHVPHPARPVLAVSVLRNTTEV